MNAVHHVIMPIAVVVDWLVWPPARRLRLRVVGWWLVYPLVYLGYSLIRGPIAHFYAYPFFDPSVQAGYPGVAVYCAALIAAFLLLGLLLIGLGNLLGRLSGGAPPSVRARS